ncbi:terminase large subunit [Abyssicoccus albus]|uniref:terminase large subunit n=1 Tax=Abyssicoccus albus TaxID=1817405 RepID=UPI00097E21A4|nr:terminase TerL endonuclease subunit [Abyssicoccus albus]AQL56423.1 terminase [Abyssicoccus albus]
MNSKDYVTEYARKVYKGDILASEKNVQAAKRHLKDLKRKDFKYHFDVERANKIIRFIEKLNDPKTGKPIRLALFQKFIVGSKYGWVDDLGDRRFTKSYVSMARKNGKTILIAGESLYEMLFGREPANERLVGLTANSREQAGIAFDMVNAQLSDARSKSERIKSLTKITESKKEILNTSDRSKVKAVSNESSNLEGYQFSYAVIDEYHEAKNKKMYETLIRGQVLLSNPALHVISTAGFNLNGPMYEEYEHVSKILDGTIENDNYFIYIAEQDSEDEVYHPETWIKSNPIMAVEELRPKITRNIQAEVNDAIPKDELNGILVKNFNMWRKSSESTYISFNDWKECYYDETVNVNGREVYIGIDMSRRDDLTAIGFIYPLDDGKYYVDSHSFIGHKGGLHAKSERDQINYEKLIETDFATLTNTESGIINDVQVYDWLMNYIEENNLSVKGIMYDPWSASNLIVRLENEPYELIEVKQDYRNLSEPLKQFKLDVFEKNIIHRNNPNLNLAINNAIEKYDNNGNVLLNKTKNRNKIDPLISVITAFTHAMHHEFGRDMEDYIMSDDFGF